VKAPRAPSDMTPPTIALELHDLYRGHRIHVWLEGDTKRRWCFTIDNKHRTRGEIALPTVTKALRDGRNAARMEIDLRLAF
jgi:hypothetical protein